MEVLLTGFVNLGMVQRDKDLWLQELTMEVQRLSLGKAPDTDGLLAEFYKHFWHFLLLLRSLTGLDGC